MVKTRMGWLIVNRRKPKKRQFARTLQCTAALSLGVFLTLNHVAQAADNISIGDVAGDTNTLGDSNVFQLFSSGTPTLVKRAFSVSAESVLTSGLYAYLTSGPFGKPRSLSMQCLLRVVAPLQRAEVSALIGGTPLHGAHICMKRLDSSQASSTQVGHAYFMLTDSYIKALLVDSVLADLVWETGFIPDEVAAIAWLLLAS